MDDECAAWLDERGVVTERVEICFLSAVDVEMVRVGSGDDAHIRTEVMERAVELISLDDYEVTLLRQYVVRAVVLGDTSEESVAVDV